jgi:uncharacterized membrane protein
MRPLTEKAHRTTVFVCVVSSGALSVLASPIAPHHPGAALSLLLAAVFALVLAVLLSRRRYVLPEERAASERYMERKRRARR